MTTSELARAIALVGIVMLLAMLALVLAVPGIDLAVSGHYAAPGGGFPVAGTEWGNAARLFFRGTSDSVPLIVLLLYGLVRVGLPVRPRLTGREAIFALLAWVVGPGLIVNWGFKDHWGRARPRDITQFGGEHVFTQPLVPTDQCVSNCSFVSGEASALACMVVVILLLAWPRLRSAGARAVLGFVLTLWAVLGSWLRIAFGGHFFSDVMFAAALMLIVVPLVWLALNRDGRRG